MACRCASSISSAIATEAVIVKTAANIIRILFSFDLACLVPARTIRRHPGWFQPHIALSFNRI
jgi:hypothetical protein